MDRKNFLPNTNRDIRIEADSGFIQKQDLGVVDKGFRKGESLFQSGGKFRQKGYFGTLQG